MMNGSEKAALAFLIFLTALLASSDRIIKNRKTGVPEAVRIPYYHADSLEALKWKRSTFLDSAFRFKFDSVKIPYSGLFKEHADSTGWDWKLLASIAYQESKFDLNAISHRGAKGLMQLTEATATRYGVKDSHDPSQNILAGASWMKDLYWRYRGCAPDPEERLKLSLAAYNAGPAHISRCIDSLKKQGIEVHSWDDISGRISEMDFFNGEETDTFVRRVQYIYQHFRRFE